MKLPSHLSLPRKVGIRHEAFSIKVATFMVVNAQLVLDNSIDACFSFDTQWHDMKERMFTLEM